MPVNGLELSFLQEDNGMTKDDMRACMSVATRLNEVIIFRSTGPWSQRWIERDYPTKNFHVKGKSSDWGPQAGFVPRRGIYSKVGGDPTKEAQGDKYNLDGLEHHYTKTTQLCLTREELDVQLTKPAAGRTALTKMQKIEGSDDLILFAKRSTDGVPFAFRAVFTRSAAGDHYKIFVFDIAHGGKPATALMFEKPVPLEVMTSSEVGAQNKPLTGDYDLMAVCPTWGNYGGRSTGVISKPGVNFGRHGGAEPGQSFPARSNLDGVLDMRTNTGLKGKQVTVMGKDGKPRQEWQTYGKAGFGAGGYNKAVEATPHMTHEHFDMGNLTPRILRCVNELNTAMGQSGPFRRVHHNAESHRNVIFGGITASDMGHGEAFPLTAFQPASLNIPNHASVCTLMNLGEFRTYATLLHNAGYFVPRSWVWGMSIRDGFVPGR